MMIDLTREELAMVAELLRTRSQELRTEVRKTDDRRYRDELLDIERGTAALLQKVQGEERGVEIHA